MASVLERGYRAFGIALAMLGGCTPEVPTPTGRHVDVHVHVEGVELCAGTVEHLDHFIEQVFAFLEEPVPDDFIVPIEVFSPKQPCDATGCLVDGTVWVKPLDTGRWDRPARLLRHELVHAVHERVWGTSIPFFNEGLAQALSSLVSSQPGSMAIGDMLDKPAEEVNYDEAGRFVRFLLDTRGVVRLRELLRGAPGKDAAGLRAWIGAVYMEPFADIEAEFLSGAPRCHYQLHLCDAADAAQLTDSWSINVLDSCQEPGFYGVSNAGVELFATRRTLELVQGGRYQITRSYAVDASDPVSQTARVTFVRCGTCDQVSIQEMYPGESELQLSAGLYALEVIMPFEREVAVDLVRVGD